MMKRLLFIYMFIFAVGSSSTQTVYNWTANTNPGWTSSNNVLRWRGGCNAVTTNCNGNYSNSTNSYYTSGVIDASCTMASTVITSFFISGFAEFGFDLLYFEYSTDGTTWTNFYGPGVGLTGDAGTGVTWTLPAIPISSTLQIRLNFQSDNLLVYSGYRITDFTIDCNVVLPVELTEFSVQNKNNENKLSWTTMSELNNSHFIVERSETGFEFEEIGNVAGLGNSVNKYVYSFTDKDYPEGKINYYRLKQVDYNGAIEYHKIISIYNDEISPKLLGTYNLLGQPVSLGYTGIVVDLYDDGTSKKRYLSK